MTFLTGMAIVFVVSVLVGGFGNYLGVRLLCTDEVTYVHAVVSAVLSTAVWVVVNFVITRYSPETFVFGGALAALLVWIGVVYLRYSGGLVRAVPIAVAAWLIAVVTLYVIATFTAMPFRAFGIPGV